MSLRSKVDRAVVAYLKSQGVADHIYPFNYSGTREFPSVTVKAGRPRGMPSTSEVKYSGDYRFLVTINVQHQGNVQEGEDSEKNRVALDELTKAVYEALMQSADSGPNQNNLKATAALIQAAGRALKTNPITAIANNNADMDEFSMTHWEESALDADVNEDGNAFIEILLFECVACASNVD